MSTLTRRDYRGPFVDIIDWFESPFTVLRPGGHPMRVEDYVQDGYYMVRAELPGMDPEKDIELTVSNGVLGITATRHEEAEGKHRSEFRYGTFSRSITLPADADEDHIQASYDYGVLEVAIKIKDQAAEDTHKRIPIMLNKHINPT
jgi:HSP20 family protein